MKKIIILLLLIIPLNIKASSINDISCTYQIKTNGEDIGYTKIIYNGYNDGNYENGRVSIYYAENNNTSSYKIINPGISFDNNKGNKINVLYQESDGKTFISKYKSNNNCPDLYYTVNGNEIIINTNNTSNKLLLIDSLYRNTKDNTWKNISDAKVDTSNEENKSEQSDLNEDKVVNENQENESNTKNNDITSNELNFKATALTCAAVLGPILLKIVKSGITILQIVGSIIAILNGMLLVIPAVVSKDADSLKKASGKLVVIAVVLALLIAIKPIISLISYLFDFDSSCVL